MKMKTRLLLSVALTLASSAMASEIKGVKPYICTILFKRSSARPMLDRSALVSAACWRTPGA
jgi:hypothetical protein